jgi:glycosyltransferase involved in cell wall biosynthesis
MGVLVPAAARRSRRVVVDAESTKRDLVEHLRVPEAKIDVVPLAATPPAERPADADEVRRRLGLGDRPVALSVSARRPHKNIARLLEALARVPRDRRPVLVVPGYPTPYEAELQARAAALGLTGDVVWPAWLDAADLEGLYAIATLVVFPSLYEGFGLPVLEAMARGVPVACSDRSSLPEVAGDAALLFDPEDTGAIQRAIERLLGDSALRERLARAGRDRAAGFTWERTAELTAAAYERALGQRA